MKTFIFLLVNLIFVFHGFSQSTFVRYIMTQTGRENKVWKCDLFLKDGKSSFICELKNSNDKAAGYNPETNTVKANTGEYDAAFSRFNTYINLSDSVIFNRRINLFGEKGEYYLVKDRLGLFKWELTEETKVVNQFPCQKATCRFRGRNFTAWFATKIPISLGPWKFNGLPGMILEVYDDKNEYHFTTQAISLPCVIDSKPLPENVTEIELEEYVKLRKLFLERKNEESMRKLQAALPRGASIVMSKQEVVGIEQEFEFEENKQNSDAD